MLVMQDKEHMILYGLHAYNMDYFECVISRYPSGKIKTLQIRTGLSDIDRYCSFVMGKNATYDDTSSRFQKLTNRLRLCKVHRANKKLEQLGMLTTDTWYFSERFNSEVKIYGIKVPQTLLMRIVDRTNIKNVSVVKPKHCKIADPDVLRREYVVTEYRNQLVHSDNGYAVSKYIYDKEGQLSDIPQNGFFAKDGYTYSAQDEHNIMNYFELRYREELLSLDVEDWTLANLAEIF